MTSAQCDCGTADPTDHDAYCVIWRQGRDLVSELREVSRREAVFGNVFALAADEIVSLQSRLSAALEERDAAGKLAKGMESDVTDLQCDLNDARSRLDSVRKLAEEFAADADDYTHSCGTRLLSLLVESGALPGIVRIDDTWRVIEGDPAVADEIVVESRVLISESDDKTRT